MYTVSGMDKHYPYHHTVYSVNYILVTDKLMRKKTEHKAKTYKLSHNLLDKIEALQEDMGLKYEISVIEYCINFTYEKKFDNYVAIKKHQQSKQKLTPEEVATRQANRYDEVKEAGRNLSYKNGLEILTQLNGEEYEDANTGVKMARFYVYSKDTAVNGSQAVRTMAVVDLFDELVATQYKNCTKSEWEELINNPNFTVDKYE